MKYAEVIQKYRPTIGLECHLQLATRSKIFCACDNDAKEAEPNTKICPVCLGLPGVLPVLNARAVELALRMGAALHGEIPERTKFDRKNYFYPDLPKGYQITQFDQPVVGKGFLEVPVGDTVIKVGIVRAHLEEDAGKLVHPPGADYSLVDLNRAGTPLLEIVSEPDMHSPAEARAYAQEIYLTARYAGVSEANLYYGNLRFDVNVSLQRVGDKELGTRAEVKNLNSFRSVERAVEFEILRQAEVLECGDVVVQETRGFIDDTGKTVSQRSKEEADEYRYFPEPDVPPLVLTEAMRKDAAKGLVTPNDVRAKLVKLGLTTEALNVVIEEPPIALGLIAELDNEKMVTAEVVKMVVSPFVTDLDIRKKALETQAINVKELMMAANASLAGEISGTQFKQAARDIELNGRTFASLNLKQVSDTGQLEKIVVTVIEANPQAQADYQAGNARALGALVGAAMKETKGQGNPQLLTQMIRERLEREV